MNTRFENINSAARVALLLVILTLGLAIRFSVAMSDIPLLGDSRTRYHPIASNLLAGHGFSRSPVPPHIPDNFDQPGYPLFLAGVYAFTGSSKKAVVLAQLVLELLVLVGVGLTARALHFPRRAQLAAIAFGFISPFLAKYAGLLLTEILATLMITLACYAFIRATQPASNDQSAWWAIAGALSGLTILVRADTVIVVGLMLVVALILVRGFALTRTIRHLGLFLVALLITLAPWTIRNYQKFRVFLPLGTVAQQSRLPYVQWLDTWVDTPAYLKPYWWDVMKPSGPTEFPASSISDPVERQRAAAAIVSAREWKSMAGHPSTEFLALSSAARRDRPFKIFIGVPVTRVVKTWFYPQINQLPTLFKTRLPFFLVFALWLVITGCTVAGLIKALRYKQYGALLLAAIIAGRLVLPLISSLGADPRMLVEALPAMYLLSAMLWVSRRDVTGANSG